MKETASQDVYHALKAEKDKEPMRLAEVQDLQAKVQELEQQHSDASEQLAALAMQDTISADDHQRILQEKETEIQEIRDAHEEKVYELEGEVDLHKQALEDAKKSHEGALADARQNALSVKKEATDGEMKSQKIAELSLEVTELQDQIREFEQKIETSESDKVKLQHALKERELLAQQQKDQVESLQRQFANHQDLQKQERDELLAKAESYDALAAAHRELEEKHESLQRDYDTVQSEHEHTETRYGDLVQDHDELRKKSETLQQQSEAWQNENADMQAAHEENERLKNENEELRKEVDANKELPMQVLELSEHLEQMNLECVDLRTERDNLANEKTAMRLEKDAVAESRRALESERDALKTELEELHEQRNAALSLKTAEETAALTSPASSSSTPADDLPKDLVALQKLVRETKARVAEQEVNASAALMKEQAAVAERDALKLRVKELMAVPPASLPQRNTDQSIQELSWAGDDDAHDIQPRSLSGQRELEADSKFDGDSATASGYLASRQAEERLKRAAADNVALTSELAMRNEEVRSLQNEIETLRNESASLSAIAHETSTVQGSVVHDESVMHADRSSDRGNGREKQLEEQLESEKIQFEEVSAQLVQATQRDDELQAAMKALEMEAHQQQEELDEVRRHNDELLTRAGELELSHESLTAELQTLKHALDVSEHTLAEAKEDAGQRIAQLQHQISEYEKRDAHLEDDLSARNRKDQQVVKLEQSDIFAETIAALAEANHKAATHEQNHSAAQAEVLDLKKLLDKERIKSELLEEQMHSLDIEHRSKVTASASAHSSVEQQLNDHLNSHPPSSPLREELEQASAKLRSSLEAFGSDESDLETMIRSLSDAIAPLPPLSPIQMPSPKSGKGEDALSEERVASAMAKLQVVLQDFKDGKINGRSRTPSPRKGYEKSALAHIFSAPKDSNFHSLVVLPDVTEIANRSAGKDGFEMLTLLAKNSHNDPLEAAKQVHNAVCQGIHQELQTNFYGGTAPIIRSPLKTGGSGAVRDRIKALRAGSPMPQRRLDLQ